MFKIYLNSTQKVFKFHACSTYKHYKHKNYVKLFEFQFYHQSKDLKFCDEPFVVYQSLYGKNEIWARPKKMFYDVGRFCLLPEKMNVEIAENQTVHHTELFGKKSWKLKELIQF